jgi:endonuclease/exonuclease/phosphatase family metal-dependent hydrolase
VVGACLVYYAAIIGLWALLGTVGDRWWLATAVMYGPRWIWAAPMAVLVPAAAAFRPRFLWLLLVTAIVIIGPVMGFCVPWPSLGSAPDGFAIRVLTCNVGGGLRPADLARVIAEAGADIVALQEGHMQLLPAEAWPVGWTVQTTVASRYPIRRVEKLSRRMLGGAGFVTRFDLETPGGLVHFVNLHLQSVRNGLQPMIFSRHRPWRAASELAANIDLRARESEAASGWVSEVSDPVLIAGDFNLPVDSDIYQRCWSSYTDAFTSAGLGFGYTWFSRWHGVRIDHILAGPGWRVRRCWVGPDVGSDHRPVVADLVWVGGSRPDESAPRPGPATVARPVTETDRRPDAPSPPLPSSRIGLLSGLP